MPSAPTWPHNPEPVHRAMNLLRWHSFPAPVRRCLTTQALAFVVAGSMLALWQADVSAAEGALRFNGANQYVELPLGETIIVDNWGPRFSRSPPEAWSEAEATGELTGSALQSTDLTAKATWTPALRRRGTYEVSVWLVSGPGNAFDPEARYLIKHRAGISTVVMDQNTGAAGWVPLGTFAFEADLTEVVALSPSGNADAPAIADAIRFVNRSTFDLTDRMTLETWVRLNAQDVKWQAIIAKGKAWGLTGFDDSNHIAFRTQSDDVTHDLMSAEPLLMGRWYHVAAVYDGVTKDLYIDGTLSGSESYSTPLAQTFYPVLLGANAESQAGDYAQIDLDNVRIWSVARTSEELTRTQSQRLRGSERGLLGDWRFDEDAGIEALDSSINTLHGLLRKTATPPTRVVGLSFEDPPSSPQALEFDGIGQHVEVILPGDGRFDFVDALTLETWVFFTFPPSSEVALVSKGRDAWELALGANGKLIFRTQGVSGELADGTIGPMSDLVSESRLDAGQWYHVAAVWNSAEGRKEIFIDGRSDEGALNLQGQVAQNDKPIHFAARPTDSGPQAFFEGVLDETRLWHSTRTRRHIAENLGRQVNGSEAGLAGVWSFDEGSGRTAIDHGPQSPPADGTLMGGMHDASRVEGLVLGPALPLQYCLDFGDTQGHVEVGSAGTLQLTDMTIEAWVKPTGSGFRNILMKGDHGYGLAIDGENYLRYFVDSTVQSSLRSDRPLAPERDGEGNLIPDSNGDPVLAWNHVGVVVDQTANTTTFYINGKQAGTHPSSIVRNNPGPIVLGKQGSVATANYYSGLLDEVRLWNIPRESLEIQLWAFTPLMTTELPDSLVGYWTFDEPPGLAVHDQTRGHHDGVLHRLGAGDWQDGTDWGMPAPPGDLAGVAPDPSSSGLWVGEVVLDQVNEAQQAHQGLAEQVTETADTAEIRILLHVAANGQVRLLKDVVLMRRSSPETPPEGTDEIPLPPVHTEPGDDSSLVLVTRPELILEFDGVAMRGGKRVGLRYGSVAYDFDGAELPLMGGVGPGTSCIGRIFLSRDHPTNPYRHKYHPDHRSGFDIVRQVTIEFDGVPGDPLEDGPGYGVDRLTGVYSETITGLHKIPLKVQGTVELNRVTSVATLNE